METSGSPEDTPAPSGRARCGPAVPPEGGGILDWAAGACRQFPDRPAIEWRDRQVSYAALDARANQIAGCLAASGIGPGSIVAVIVADRIEIVAALLGVFRAGCVFVPLGEDGAPERLRQHLARLAPDALVLGDGPRERPSALREGTMRQGVIVMLAAGRPPSASGRCGPAAEPSHGSGDRAVAAPAGRRAPAYVYYTSGSTGQPKGIAGTLEGLSHFIGWETKTFGIGPGWRVSQFTVPTFDSYFRDVFVPLCTGGTVCIPPDLPFSLQPAVLMDWIDEQGINLVHCAPTLFAMMLDAELGLDRCRALRHVLLAGEVLQAAHVRRWRKAFGDRIGLANLYGPTETTMVKLFHVVREHDLRRGFIPIGRPIEGAEALLLDERGKPCAPGRVGEIHIRSRYLALGYFRDPAATEEAFLPDVDGDGDARLYRTGDLAVELDDGSYRFVGRSDDQVKIRGVRVEPGEVTSVLSQCPQVRSCVVVARTTARQETVLVAYVVPATRDPISMPELRTFLRQRLPAEMAPSAFVFLERLPLTDRGKVDRKALPAPAPGRCGLPGEMVAPRTPTEARLAAFWCDLLGLDEVGVRDDFLHLGGHSLTAVRLAARVRTQFGVEIPFRTVFERPTIEKLAEYIAGEAVRNATATRGRSTAQNGRPSDETRPDPRRRGRAPHPAAASAYRCPTAPSALFGRRECNLVIVVNEQVEQESFERLAGHVAELDPSIHAVVVRDTPAISVPLRRRPALILAPAFVRNRSSLQGSIFCGYPLSKSEEYEALERAGIPVPRWALLTADQRPDLSAYGEYVVRKPNYGAKGAEVRIVRRDRVRWRPLLTGAAGLSLSTIIQEFIYTGPRPVSYRVNTLFGRVLYCARFEANRSRPALAGPDDFRSPARQDGVSIVSAARDGHVEPVFDKEVIGLGEAAHAAFPRLPFLGVDILREVPSGRLYVVEVNALGYNWNFTSRHREEFGGSTRGAVRRDAQGGLHHRGEDAGVRDAVEARPLAAAQWPPPPRRRPRAPPAGAAPGQ